jgi:hypothetical protein
MRRKERKISIKKVRRMGKIRIKRDRRKGGRRSKRSISYHPPPVFFVPRCEIITS